MECFALQHTLCSFGSGGLALSSTVFRSGLLFDPLEHHMGADACTLCMQARDSKPQLPLVLLVHGGPWARDSWGYSSMPQWLANRGYACLQVNYRSGEAQALLHTSCLHAVLRLSFSKHKCAPFIDIEHTKKSLLDLS